MVYILETNIYNTFMSLKPNIPDGAKVPEIWRKNWKTTSVELKEEGTLWFIDRSDSVFFWKWVQELHERFPNDLIPLQWVPEYVRVSRVAVLKRANAGKMHVFSFIVTAWEKNFLGTAKVRDTKTRYDYALLSECVAWRDGIMERSIDDKE